MESVQQREPELATYSVREAGKILGLGKDAAYGAAKAGKIPVLKFGRFLRVPCVALHKMLENAGALNDREAA